MEPDADGVTDGDFIVLGPWTVALTSERRVQEVRSHPLFGGLIKDNIAEFSATDLLQYAYKNATSLLVNPNLAFGRKFDLAEIEDILKRND